MIFVRERREISNSVQGIASREQENNSAVGLCPCNLAALAAAVFSHNWKVWETGIVPSSIQRSAFLSEWRMPNLAGPNERPAGADMARGLNRPVFVVAARAFRCRLIK